MMLLKGLVLSVDKENITAAGVLSCSWPWAATDMEEKVCCADMSSYNWEVDWVAFEPESGLREPPAQHNLHLNPDAFDLENCTYFISTVPDL